MKISRLLETVTLLLNREAVTARELAERFGVSMRTIYRDIEVLSLAGVPVYTNRGSNGGISLLENYTLNKALLSKEESESLLLAIKALGATSYPEADAIMDKLGSVFKGSKVHDWVLVDFEGWSSKANEQDRFSTIRDAIISKRIISFDYVNAHGDTGNRSVEPDKLIFNASTWYLVAYCLKRAAHRMFRLSRIKNVQILDQHFVEREIPEHAKGSSPRAPLVGLKLRCDEKVLSRLYDNFDGECISKHDDGSYGLAVTVPEEEWVYGFILSLGGYAEVLAPAHVREIIKVRAQEITKKY
ncbi:MAG: YafY family transcriptional regulator [Coriobacteriia bacterium]|nr:YafY family transcriptional regulator [Coriobacteriia bacterium]